MRAVAVLVDGRKVSGRRQDGHLERSEVSEGALDVVGLEGELARLGRRQQAGVLQRRRRGAQPQLGRRTGRPAARLAAAAAATAAAVGRALCPGAAPSAGVASPRRGVPFQRR